MIKKYRLKRRFLLLSIPVFLILSILALYLNGIFVYSEFKPSIEVKYSLEDQTKLKELVDNTVKMNHVSKVERRINLVEFQGVNLDEVKTNIQSLTSGYEGVTYTVKEVSAIHNGVLTALISALYLLFIAGIAIHFYFIATKGGDLKIIIGSYGVFLLVITDAVLISLGLLSLVSRFYKVTALDLCLILIAQIIAFVGYYLASFNINEIKNFQYLGVTYKEFVVRNFRPILLVLLLLLGLISIGLGINFVIHAILLAIFVIISQFTLLRIGYVLENHTNIKESLFSKTERVKNLRKKKVIAQAPQNSSKKKDKKKKKKK